MVDHSLASRPFLHEKQLTLGWRRKREEDRLPDKRPPSQFRHLCDDSRLASFEASERHAGRVASLVSLHSPPGSLSTSRARPPSNAKLGDLFGALER